jgi:hypothetical protein
VDGSGNTCSRTEGTSNVYGLGYSNGLPCDAGKIINFYLKKINLNKNRKGNWRWNSDECYALGMWNVLRL